VSDQGFDFQRKPDRREKPSFEIPPWERQAFEELQKRRGEGAEEAPAQDEDQSLKKEEIQPVPGSMPVEVEQGATDLAASAGHEPVPTQDQAPVVTEVKKGPSEAQLLELLAGLAEEEPNLSKHFASISLAVAMVLGPFGLVLIVWGMAAVAKAEAASSAALIRTAGAGLVVFGAAFVAGAFWTVYRVMKQRGVL